MAGVPTGLGLEWLAAPNAANRGRRERAGLLPQRHAAERQDGWRMA